MHQLRDQVSDDLLAEIVTHARAFFHHALGASKQVLYYKQ